MGFAWNKRTVHGTKMSAAYWVLRTKTGKLVSVEYNTTGKGAVVHEEGVQVPIILADEQSGEFIRDNVHVQFVSKNKLRVKTDKWEMADEDVVAPHGIFGQ